MTNRLPKPKQPFGSKSFHANILGFISGIIIHGNLASFQCNLNNSHHKTSDDFIDHACGRNVSRLVSFSSVVSTAINEILLATIFFIIVLLTYASSLTYTHTAFSFNDLKKCRHFEFFLGK